MPSCPTCGRWSSNAEMEMHGPSAPRAEALSPQYVDLREAAHDLLIACDMEQHNVDIFKGKWKKGSKAWSGEFVEKMKADALVRVRALTEPKTAGTISPQLTKEEK